MRSHQRASSVSRGGFSAEVIPIQGHDKDAEFVLSKDEVIRPDSSLEMLSSLRPVFDPKYGTVTAVPAISDGASIIILMSDTSKRIKIRATSCDKINV